MRRVMGWRASRAGGMGRALALLGCVLALILAGCGGGSGATQAPTAPATAHGGSAGAQGTTTPGAATPGASATTASAPAASDAYAAGQALPHSLGGPDTWAWHASLPGSRFILYYGVVGAPTAGVIGYYGGDENALLDRLRAQAQQYAQADPSHPVTMGLDVVEPLADAFPQQGYYVDRMDANTLQHYVDLTRDNHMVLFFDMQIGYSNLQREMAYLMPYLQYPWVHLAIDPEWDHAYGGQGEGCPGFADNINATGRMYASEVNYVIDQLSALVVSQHLPPKTLILHQYQVGENPSYDGYVCGNHKPSESWKNIQLKPGVNLVLNCDGVGSSLWGGLGTKIDVYNVVESEQLSLGRIINQYYAGIKLYYYYPDLGLDPNFYDDPQMTPQEVLSLNPAPLLVMYQ